MRFAQGVKGKGSIRGQGRGKDSPHNKKILMVKKTEGTAGALTLGGKCFRVKRKKSESGKDAIKWEGGVFKSTRAGAEGEGGHCLIMKPGKFLSIQDR